MLQRFQTLVSASVLAVCHLQRGERNGLHLGEQYIWKKFDGNMTTIDILFYYNTVSALAICRKCSCGSCAGGCNTDASTTNCNPSAAGCDVVCEATAGFDGVSEATAGCDGVY